MAQTTDNKTITRSQPIDVVITWVDGNDPRIIERRESCLRKTKYFAPLGANPTRFASNNEIKYCVLSILTFAPFVRNIYIVTDGQDPNIYKDVEEFFPERSNSIKIVDHKDIFMGYEEFLPTFNSIPIENLMWRIHGLSENFVYFNDDFFLIREVQPQDWVKNNRPILQGKWLPAPRLRVAWDRLRITFNTRLLGKRNYQPRHSFHITQWLAAALVGYRIRYFVSLHTPYVINRSRIEQFFSENPHLLRKNLSFRFRDYFQFNIAALSNHLEIVGNNKQFSKPHLAYLQPYKRSRDYIDRKIEHCEKNHCIKFICVQSLDLCDSDVQNKILGWLEKKIMRQIGV